MRITATGDETALSGIMRLVKDAQESQNRHANFGRQSSGVAILRSARGGIYTATAWTIAVGFDIEVIRRVVAVLVIACPHALGLAVPLVVAITTSRAASNGILIRDRAAPRNGQRFGRDYF